MPSNSSSYAYTVTANDDALSGVLSQSETGSDRYSLLETFNNVANTSSGSTPGNMNFSTFGQPFVDPDAIQTYQNRANQIAGLRHAAIVQLTVSNQAQIVIIQYYRNQNIIDDVEANQMRADEQVRYQTQFVSIHSYYNSLDQQNRGFFLSGAYGPPPSPGGLNPTMPPVANFDSMAPSTLPPGIFSLPPAGNPGILDYLNGHIGVLYSNDRGGPYVGINVGTGVPRLYNPTGGNPGAPPIPPPLNPP